MSIPYRFRPVSDYMAWGREGAEGSTPMQQGPPPVPDRRRRTLDIPPAYFLASAVLMALLCLWLPGPRLVPSRWRWLGLLPIAGGVALGIAGERAFKRAGTALLPFSEPSALVTAGPFAFTRNPMYLGMVLCLAGWAILLGAATPLVVVPAFLGLIHGRFVRREEPFMAEHFGEAYAAYKARVRRWL